MPIYNIYISVLARLNKMAHIELSILLALVNFLWVLESNIELFVKLN
jgi:hypothetical protein